MASIKSCVTSIKSCVTSIQSVFFSHLEPFLSFWASKLRHVIMPRNRKQTKSLRLFALPLGAFAKLWKATICFLSVPPYRKIPLPLDRFVWNTTMLAGPTAKVWYVCSSEQIQECTCSLAIHVVKGVAACRQNNQYSEIFFLHFSWEACRDTQNGSRRRRMLPTYNRYM